MDRTRALRRFDALSHLAEGQFEQLAECLEEKSLAPRQTLFREGDESSEVYLIASGELRAHRGTAFGSFDLATIREGEILGEIGFVAGCGRTTDVESATPVDLLVLSPATLEAAAAADPALELALYWALWRSLSAKLRATNGRVSGFFGGDDGEAAAADGAALRLGAERVHVDMATKRGIFQEQALSGLEINFLSSLSREERYDAGQVIFKEGEEGERMYVVADGQVVISTWVPGAGEEALAILARGDYFGEMALIDHAPRSATARAHPESGAVVLAVSSEVLEGILDIQKVSSLRLLKILCLLVAKRLREIDEKLVGWFLVAGGQVPAGA